MTNTSVEEDALMDFIERIEKLLEERKAINDAIKECYQESKACGLEPKIMRQIIRLRDLNPDEYQENETLMIIYKKALGMLINIFDEIKVIATDKMVN